MLTLPPSLKNYLCTALTGKRKGHNGLSALVKHQINNMPRWRNQVAEEAPGREWINSSCTK